MEIAGNIVSRFSVPPDSAGLYRDEQYFSDSDDMDDERCSAPVPVFVDDELVFASAMDQELQISQGPPPTPQFGQEPPPPLRFGQGLPPIPRFDQRMSPECSGLGVDLSGRVFAPLQPQIGSPDSLVTAVVSPFF